MQVTPSEVIETFYCELQGSAPTSNTVVMFIVSNRQSPWQPNLLLQVPHVDFLVKWLAATFRRSSTKTLKSFLTQKRMNRVPSYPEYSVNFL